MARPALDLRGVEPVEDEDHHNMAEGAEAERRIRPELGGVQDDLRLHRVPGIVHGLGPAAADMADGQDAEAHWKIGTAAGSWITGGGMSMTTLAGSTAGPRSRNQVTLSGQAITIATSSSCRHSHGMAPR